MEICTFGVMILFSFLMLKTYCIIFSEKPKTCLPVTVICLILMEANFFITMISDLKMPFLLALVLLIMIPARYLLFYSLIFKKFNLRYLYIGFLFIELDFYITGIERDIGVHYTQLSVSIIEVVLILILYLFVRKDNTATVVYSNIRRIPVRIYIAILIFIVLVEIVLESLRSEDVRAFGKFAALPLIVVMAYIVVSLMRISISDNEQREVVKVLDTQLKNQTDYYEKINDIYTEFRAFRHDFKNHLICLRSLLADGDTDKALSYMSDVESISYTEKHSYETGNVIADVLLNDKSEKAEKYNVKINYSGFIPTMGITDVDICTLMSNAIDNAIEACAKDKSKDWKEVTVTADFKQGCFFFTVRNPIFEKVQIQKDNKIRTTKADKAIHGYGISNIIKVSKKYNGDTKIRVDKDKKEFILESHLFLDKNI